MASSCSTTGLDLKLEPQEDLPEAVAATREAIFDAAMSCDYEALQALEDAGQEPFTGPGFGWGGVEVYIEDEAYGFPVLADMARHLNQPYAFVVYEDGDYYTWPSAFELLETPYGDGLPDADYQKLLELYTTQHLEDMFNGIGGYIGWRHGILADGEWEFFVEGD